MARTKTELLGVKETREAMQELTGAMQRNVGRRSLMIPAEILFGAVRERAPVLSGALRESGKIYPGKGKARTVAVIFENPAAVPVEFGTTKMGAEPFFRPAVDASEAEMLRAFSEALTSEVVRATERAARRAKAKAG